MNGSDDDLLSLAALLNATDDVMAIQDADFKCLMNGEAFVHVEEEPLALEDAAPDLFFPIAQDEETMADMV